MLRVDPHTSGASDGLTFTQQASATGTAGPEEGPHHTQHSVSAAVAGEQLEHAYGSVCVLTALEYCFQGVLAEEAMQLA